MGVMRSMVSQSKQILKLHSLRNQSSSVVPKGHCAVYVGETEKKRFIVPLSYLNHPSFQNLLSCAEEEFGLLRSITLYTSLTTMGIGLRSMALQSKHILKRASSVVDVPKGHCVVYVGETEKKSFIVPVSYLNHPAFQDLLSRAEEEFGFDHPMGGLTIPCKVSAFVDLTSQSLFPFLHFKMVIRFRSMVSRSKQILKLQSLLTQPASSLIVDVPKGHCAVYVGETEKKRFLVPISYLNHPMFQDLLRSAEEEFGFDHPMGGLTIPCKEAAFIDLTTHLLRSITLYTSLTTMGIGLRSMALQSKHILKRASSVVDVPKGHCVVYVGETEKKSFIVPVSYLNHPAFQDLLSRAEEEFGFDHPMGGLTIPCKVSAFSKQILKLQSLLTQPASSLIVDVPKGHCVVYVGETEKKRFLVPISYLNHPMFQDLLRSAEEEFGFDHPMGGLTIPCKEAAFIDLTTQLNAS
ncbi:hypothetical protein C5167_026979 [Papaver somniferum]|nr:hypothetical protein C5167_026979 [Papaver somniferum]